MTHKDLVKIAYRWVLTRASCGCAFKEFRTAACNGEFPDVIGFGACRSVLVEVKATRSDFLADKKKSFRANPQLGMGMYRFYLCPAYLIIPEDLPAGWGLIYVNPKGKAQCVVNPYCVNVSGTIWSNGLPRNIQAEQDLMYSALRRIELRGLMERIYENPLA